MPPEPRLAGTRIQFAAAAYGTPTLTPRTVPAVSPAPLLGVTVVAGAGGAGSDGSRTAAVSTVSPAATPASRARW